MTDTTETDGRPDLNSGTPWSELAISDLRCSASQGQTAREAAVFLCRSVKEVRDKADELRINLRE
jgi:hypothetical protein